MGYGKEEEKEMQDFAPLLSFHIQWSKNPYSQDRWVTMTKHLVLCSYLSDLVHMLFNTDV
jgi:hypothetical protein